MIELSENPKLLADRDGNPYDRLGGWENELGYTSTPKLVEASIELPKNFVWTKEMKKMADPEALLFLHRGQSNYYDDDGFHRYIDVNFHPESCTPEHLDYLDLAYSSLYGITKMSRVLHEAGEHAKKLGLDPQMVITANNSNPAGSVWATHHNLIARRGLEIGDYEDALIAHYVSRIVWAGSGAPIPNDSGKYQFGLSARADHIYEEVSSGTTRNRPFINTRDVAYADREYFRRLHGINGEFVFSPQVLAAVMATESILLRACELGVKFDDLRPLNPLRAIREVSHDPTLQQTILIKGVKEEQPERVTAIELQRKLINRALDAAGKSGYLTEQEKHYGKVVNEYLDLLVHKDQKLTECKRLFDWVLKEEILDRYAVKPRENNMTDYDMAWAAILAFHRVYPTMGSGLRRLRKGMYVLSPSDEVFDNGPGLPPTRAKPRANAIRILRRAGLIVSGNWEYIAVHKVLREGEEGSDIGSVALSDPYAVQSDDLDRLTRRALAMGA